MISLKLTLSSSTKLILYADDILLSAPFSSSSDFTTIQIDINTMSINDWTQSHLLKINAQKNKIHAYFQEESIISILNSSTIECVYSYKYIGVVINSNLSWSPHISSVCSKSLKILGYIFCNFYRFSSPISLFTLYSSLVLPHLSYCSSLWDPHTKSDIKRLKSIQKFALRICSKQYHSNYDRNLELFNLVPLSTRRAISKLTLLFKFMSGFTFLPNGILSLQPSPRPSRYYHTNNISIPFYCSSAAFYYFIPSSSLWNSLPHEVKSCDSISI